MGWVNWEGGEGMVGWVGYVCLGGLGGRGSYVQSRGLGGLIMFGWVGWCVALVQIKPIKLSNAKCLWFLQHEAELTASISTPP